MLTRLKNMPVAVLPTFVGTLTLSNVYGGLGYTWVRYAAMIAGTIIVILYFIKIALYPDVCKKEYSQTVPASLYAGLTMCLMILGSFYYEKGLLIGKIVWMIAVFAHIIHILIFTFNNVIKKRNLYTTVPSWFVTYNGLLVSAVTGGAMGMNGLLRIISLYGVIIYLILIPIIIFRLLTVPVKADVYHTMAVVLAPCSLCVVGLSNTCANSLGWLKICMYICVLISLSFIIIKLPAFFSFSFTPGFAGLTFPMAIGIVATNKMAAFFGESHKALATACTQLSGFQIFLTSMLIGYVLVNFARMALKIKMR
ncbi:MAG: TDT family transporter [bacterium]